MFSRASPLVARWGLPAGALFQQGVCAAAEATPSAHANLVHNQTFSNGQQGWASTAAAVAAAAAAVMVLPFSAAAADSQVRPSAADAAVIQQVQSDPSASVLVLLEAPLAVLLGASLPLGPSALQAVASAVPSNLGDALSWESGATARGLAILLGPQLQAVNPNAVAAMHQRLEQLCASGQASPEDIASQAWSCAVVSGSLTPQQVASLQAGLGKLTHPGTWSDPAALLLLDALVITAAHTAGSGSPPVPRVSRQAFESFLQAGRWSSAARTRLLAAYDDWMPLEDFVVGGVLPILHAALAIPHLAAASSSSGGGGGARSTGVGTWLGGLLSPGGGNTSGSGGGDSAPASPAMHAASTGLPPGAAESALALLGKSPSSAASGPSAAAAAASHRECARLRRDVQVHWRQDELVDVRQRAANEVAYLIAHRLGQQVIRAPDADLLLPRAHLLITVHDDLDVKVAAGAMSGTKATQSSNTMPRQAPGPFSLAAGQQALSRLARERLAPAAQYHRSAAPGLELARETMWKALGWRHATVELSAWLACGSSEPAKLLLLQQLVA